MNIKATTFNKQTLITFEENCFSVTFSTLGASFVQILHNNEELIYSPIDKNDMEKSDYYYGKTIGPICNRVEKGIIYLNGKAYFLHINESPNALHGGSDGISHKYFDYEIDQKENSITFTYHKKAYEDGLPGNVIYIVKYVVKHMEIQLFYDVTSDEETVISLTNHVYFCLKDKDVTKFFFKGNFDKYVVPGKDDLLPKEIREIPYYLDFTNKLSLGKYLYLKDLQNQRTKGYDFDLIFKKESENHTVILEDSAYKLTINSNYESVQIYTDNYENPYPFKDIKLNKYGSVSIEPCDITLNRPLLHKGEHYMRKITYTIKEK